MTVLIGRLISGLMTLGLGILFIIFGDLASVDSKDSHFDTIFFILGIVMIIVGGINSLGSFQSDEHIAKKNKDKLGEAA